MATRPSTDVAASNDVRDPCRVVCLGTIPYLEAWELQVAIADRVRSGSEPDTLLLLEHPHTYTRGRLSPDSDFLIDEATARSRAATVVETDRGGLITYHGPGQLVAYPIIRLRGRGGPHWYVRSLERVIAASLAEYGLASTTVPGLTGVWTPDGQRKLAAIGVKIAGGVAYHGFAINVRTDLSRFEAIVPCGINDRGVSSMAAELTGSGAGLKIDAFGEVVASQFCQHFGLKRTAGAGRV